MRYCMDMGLWNTVFAVPKALVDKHIKLAGKEQLKTILWLLAHSGEPISIKEISLATGITIENAEDAVLYWLNCGFIHEEDSETQVKPNQIKAASKVIVQTEEPENVVEEKIALVPKKRLIRPDGHYVATRINESPEIQYMIQEAQMVLGKTISPALSAALVAIHEDYGIPVEVVMMLINYVKEAGKTGTGYIESVAKDWYESNIFTIESAEQKLLELSEMRLAWRKFVSTIGIHDRPPSKKEEKVTYTWFSVWKMSTDMISEAYERCVNATGKLNMAYINKIIESWHNLGYKSIKDVNEAEEKRKGKQEKRNEKSYDLDEIEKDGFFKIVEDL